MGALRSAIAWRPHRSAPRPVAIVVAAAFLAAGCAGTGERSGGHPGVRTSVESKLQEVHARVTVLEAECMDDSGYSQLLEAEASRPFAEPYAYTGMVYWHPLETGPTTTEEAEAFGLRGLSFAFQQGLAGDLIGDDPSFTAALEACRSALGAELGEDVHTTLNAWIETRSAIRHVFIGRALGHAEPLVAEVMSCFLDGLGWTYDLGDAPSFDALLDAHGVAEGRTSVAAAEQAELSGSMRAAARSPMIYQPSEDEVVVAKAFAGCVATTDFVERLDEAQTPSRDSTLADHHSELAWYEGWADRVLDALREVEERRST